MPLDPKLLNQALRTPESQDVTETPIVRAVILPDPANAAHLVPVMTRPDTLESRNARRILCQYGPEAVPHLVAAAVATGNARVRVESLGVLWAMLTGEESWTRRERIADSAAGLSTMLRDKSPIPDELPDYIERDFRGRVCDLGYLVVQELLMEDTFDQSTFRTRDNDGRDQAITQLLSRGFSNPVA